MTGRGDPPGGNSSGSAEWDQFARRLATVTGVGTAQVQPDARLVDDLGLDSIAIAEVVVMLLADYQLDGLSERLQSSNWRDVTVGTLYDEYRTGRRASEWQVRAD
jgi:acyl carrier protein